MHEYLGMHDCHVCIEGWGYALFPVPLNIFFLLVDISGMESLA